jgi:hypothetical protein
MSGFLTVSPGQGIALVHCRKEEALKLGGPGGNSSGEAVARDWPSHELGQEFQFLARSTAHRLEAAVISHARAGGAG